MALRCSAGRAASRARPFLPRRVLMPASFHTTCRTRQDPRQTHDDRTTHFGFETVLESAKESKGDLFLAPAINTAYTDIGYVVGAVFSSVASSYDTMNDLMSLGIHRLWKDHFVRSLNPGSATEAGDQAKGWNILDIAGGTGDIAFRMLDHATVINKDTKTRVTVSDINLEMLAEGRKRSLETPHAGTERLAFLEANAEKLPMVESNSIDLYTVAFGIRNFTNKQRALEEAYRVLKPGGVFACLEFSKVNNQLFNSIYKRWSFSAIPIIGQLVAADRASYQYLVESIEKFPSQVEFSNMIKAAGFLIPGQGWEDLTGGIAAIHKGVKPLK
ncbi:2-hexaprenyl-6-methoxy-1,4-benzoquinone methyltransferase [Trapelia coarctata]|nr:2-hexaprenyl-6-methoxy-1,4-benzoquinone methyltransferase [Trapelia coarctata]